MVINNYGTRAFILFICSPYHIHPWQGGEEAGVTECQFSEGISVMLSRQGIRSGSVVHCLLL